MPRRKPLTWTRALKAFESLLRARRSSPRTLQCYLLEVEYLRQHLECLGPDQVRLGDLRDYLCGLLTGTASRSRRPLSASSAAKTATVLSVFFGFLRDEGLLGENPAQRLERPKVPRYPPGEVLTVKEIKKLLTTPSVTTPLEVRDRVLVETFYATGLRLSEARALDLADLDHQGREVVVRSGKGEKGRVVPITRSAYLRVIDYVSLVRPALCSRHPDSAVALFLSQRGRRLGVRALADALKKLGRQAGLRKTVKPHMLRRTFASTLLKAGVSVRHIQLLLGHADLNTTALYLRLDTRELRRELLLKHPRETFDA